jgi:phosphatidate cytidylyltransferase
VTEGEAAPAAAAGDGSQNFLTRVLAAAVLAPVAIGIVWLGGWPWALLVTLASIGLYVEWLFVVGLARAWLAIVPGVATLAIAGICLIAGRLDAALVMLGVGLVAVAALSPERRNWAVTGFLYAAAAEVASVLVRLHPDYGFSALFFVLLVVWAADIGGYFAGRGIGGPKLWPKVSPKKTWAGAIGGFAGGLAVAGAFAAVGTGKAMPLLALAAFLSVISQLGDLFESAVKRRFGVKDSSHVIPGHGGLMDRLDGFVAAVVAAAIFGFLRGGVDGVGRGLMVW